jgi:hypothetical protein
MNPSKTYAPKIPSVIGDILNHKFAPISLSEIEKETQLMERFDFKTYFDISKLEAVLEDLSKNYKVLTIKEENLFEYKTLYYDTDDLKFYKEHHNGHLNRYKVRAREYVSSKIFFLEVKFKNNKNKTLKNRISTNGLNYNLSESERKFIETYPELGSLSIKPALWVLYQRITLVGIHKPERVTIDINLTFDNGVQNVQYPNLVVMEVKADKSEGNSPITEVLLKHRFFPKSVSKYTCGMAACYQNIKKNNFKRTVQNLQSYL